MAKVILRNEGYEDRTYTLKPGDTLVLNECYKKTRKKTETTTMDELAGCGIRRTEPDKLTTQPYGNRDKKNLG